MSGPEREVTLKPPGAGAYRVTIVGASQDNVVSSLVVGGRDEPAQLAPGDYTAFIESVSSTGNTVTTFSVPDRGPAVVELGPNPDQDQSSQIQAMFRPSHGGQDDVNLDAVYARFFKTTMAHARKLSAADAPPAVRSAPAPESRPFVIGVSGDTAPQRHGGWRAAEIETQIEPPSTSGEVTFVVMRPQDWLQRPKLRLTISVAGDTAWRMGLPLFYDGVRLTLRPTRGPAGADLIVSMRPVDENRAVIVGSLQRALPDEVDQLLQSAGGVADPALAIEILDEKMEDPWAAAAAALLLVRSGRVTGAADHLTRRLADRFDWLPDAAVAAAWVEIMSPTTTPDKSPEEVCLDRLIDARRRGAPYFALSNNLALELLTTLAISSHGVLRRKVNQERTAWSTRSRRALRTGAFLSWELPAGELTSAVLPPANYGTLVKGDLTAEAVTIGS